MDEWSEEVTVIDLLSEAEVKRPTGGVGEYVGTCGVSNESHLGTLTEFHSEYHPPREIVSAGSPTV